MTCTIGLRKSSSPIPAGIERKRSGRNVRSSVVANCALSPREYSAASVGNATVEMLSASTPCGNISNCHA